MTKYGQAVRAGEAIGLATLSCPGSCDQAVVFPAEGAQEKCSSHHWFCAQGLITRDLRSRMDHSQAVAAGAEGSDVHEASAPLSRMGPFKVVCSLLGCQPVPWWCQHHPTSMEAPTPSPGEMSVSMWALLFKPLEVTSLRSRLYCHPAPWVPVW